MKSQPTPRQRTTIRNQRALADTRRDEREQRAAGEPRGPRALASRIVQGLRRQKAQRFTDDDEPRIRYEWLHQHHDASRRTRVPGKRGHRSRNVPYRNPARDVKSLRSGRLRKELRP